MGPKFRVIGQSSRSPGWKILFLGTFTCFTHLFLYERFNAKPWPVMWHCHVTWNHEMTSAGQKVYEIRLVRGVWILRHFNCFFLNWSQNGFRKCSHGSGGLDLLAFTSQWRLRVNIIFIRAYSWYIFLPIPCNLRLGFSILCSLWQRWRDGEFACQARNMLHGYKLSH